MTYLVWDPLAVLPYDVLALLVGDVVAVLVVFPVAGLVGLAARALLLHGVALGALHPPARRDNKLSVLLLLVRL